MAESRQPSGEIPATRMSAEDAAELYQTFERLGITIWVDGGWGVDALLGEQTRQHSDLDIVIQRHDLPAMRALLASRGYRDMPRDDTRPWNFVLGDAHGREVDIHVIVFDAEGNGIYGPAEHGEQYPAAALTGSGSIAGQPVRCISPEVLVMFHTGYPLRERDLHDVAALCERFGIAYPEEYAHLPRLSHHPANVEQEPPEMPDGS